MQKLTTTQIGAVAENIVANEVMTRSRGRLSPFVPVADDGGIDLLVYDKKTGLALPLQIKARTVTLKKRTSAGRGNLCHFSVRRATLRADKHAWLFGILLDDRLASIRSAVRIKLTR